MTKATLLDKAKNIPIPEPGTGEVVTISSIELLCVWMQLNQLKAKGWKGNILEITPVTESEVRGK